MIGIEVNATKLKELRHACGRAKKDFGKELAGAINQVSKKTKLNIGRDVRSVIAMKKKESESGLRISNKATADNPQVTVTLKKEKRLGLRHFGARQDKRGVSYKISKTGGRQRVDGAFQGPVPGAIRIKWKGNVFKRVGKERLPIVQLKGVSPYGAYVKNDFPDVEEQAINDELDKQMTRRINLNVLRANRLVPK